jgi:hypothetical protein
VTRVPWSGEVASRRDSRAVVESSRSRASIRPGGRDLIILRVFLGPNRSAALDFGCLRLGRGCRRAWPLISDAAAIRSGPSPREPPSISAAAALVGRGATWEGAASMERRTTVARRWSFDGEGWDEEKKGQRTRKPTSRACVGTAVSVVFPFFRGIGSR